MSQRVDKLLSWCDERGIELSGIKIIDTSIDPTTNDPGIRVVADRDLAHSDLVAKIPKTSILSKRTSSLLPNDSDMESQTNDVLELSLVLAYELALGELSEWFGYLQSLPPEQVPIAALWEGNDDQDSQLAALWLQGTETNQAVQHLSKNFSFSVGHFLAAVPRHPNIQETISDYYHRVACPTLARVGCATTLQGFRLALSLVSSRSFRVDSYHGLAMVPIADAFNHTGENQVHIETDFDVCPSCGSLQSCPHDDEHDAAPSEEGTLCLENTCDMVMNAPVSAGDEVFNSYDSNLPNSVLLARYGFILEGNESDFVSWTNTRLPPVMQGCIRALSEGLGEIWTEEILNKSSLVYDSRGPLAVTSAHDPTSRGRSPTREPHFRINSDGLTSVDLWTVAAVCAVKAVRDDPLGSITRASLSQLARAQVYAEGNVEYATEDGDQKDTGISSSTWLELKILANLAQDLCRSRLEGMHRPELSVAECGNLLDSLPEGMVRSRMAVAQALSERATLVTCRDAWSDLVAAIDDTDPELNST